MTESTSTLKCDLTVMGKQLQDIRQMHDVMHCEWPFTAC